MAARGMDHSRRSWVLAALEQYEGPLVRYAQRMTRDEHAARDVVQHAFLRLCDQSPDDIRQSVGAWLYAVCRNRVIDLERKERRMQRCSDVHQVDCASDAVGPEHDCEVQDTSEQLRKVVGTLTAEQQEAVDLWSEGFSYREISQITERKETTIRVQVHRALKQIRQHPLVQQLLVEAADVAAET